ncbi:TetR/AcrR family transcriptional regulator [Angustibacter aerolatus]
MSQREPAARRMPPEQRRAHLLAAGLRLLDDGGPAAVTAEGVAEAAGTSRTLALHYFGSLRGLQAAVVVAAIERLTERALGPRLDDPQGRVVARMGLFLDAVAEHPAGSLAALRGPLHDEPEVAAALAAWRRGFLGELVGTAVEQGLPATPALDLVGRAWTALFEEAVIGWLETDGVTRAQLTDLLDRAVVLLGGWLREPEVRALLSPPSSRTRASR